MNFSWLHDTESDMTESFATPWTVTGQALLFMEFSRQEYWSEWSFSFSRGASPSRDEAQVSCIEAGCFTILAIRESPPSKEAWVKSMDYHNGSQKWGHKMWIEYSKSSSFNYIEYRWALISETSWNFWPKKYSTLQWLFSYVAKLWSCFSDRNR